MYGDPDAIGWTATPTIASTIKLKLVGRKYPCPKVIYIFVPIVPNQLATYKQLGIGGPLVSDLGVRYLPIKVCAMACEMK